MKLTPANIIRILLVGEVVSLAISFVFYFALPWPQAMHDFLDSPDSHGKLSDSLLTWLGIPIVALYLVAWIGLWRNWSPAKYFYISSLLLAAVLTLFTGPIAMLPAEEIMAGTSYMCTGAILLMLFVHPHIIRKTD